MKRFLIAALLMCLTVSNANAQTDVTGIAAAPFGWGGVLTEVTVTGTTESDPENDPGDDFWDNFGNMLKPLRIIDRMDGVVSEPETDEEVNPGSQSTWEIKFITMGAVPTFDDFDDAPDLDGNDSLPDGWEPGDSWFDEDGNEVGGHDSGVSDNVPGNGPIAPPKGDMDDIGW